MNSRVERKTVDLSPFPDLVVIYLGMRVNALTGVKTLFGFGPQIKNSVDQQPDGLLLHENFIMSLIPLHLGMRQYWRDFDALEAWARSTPHREWWRDFLRSSRGTGFWHEAYFMRGGMEAVYDDVPVPLGFGQFAPMQPARGPMFSARTRAKLAGEPRPAVVEEAELYGVSSPQSRSSSQERPTGSGATSKLANFSLRFTAGFSEWFDTRDLKEAKALLGELGA